MAEDEFDFTGKNLAELLPIDKKAVPLDYEARLKQKGYTETSPPDIEELFKTLATDYVPTRVVSLPPKRVRRVRMRDYLPSPSLRGLFGWIISVMFLLGGYALIVVVPGIYVPYLFITSYQAKVNTHSSGNCIVTSTDIHEDDSTDSDTGSVSTSYDAKVYFILRTQDGKSYQTQEYWPSSFSEYSDAQQYTSQFQNNQTYQCWYDAANPTHASLSKPYPSFWDYFWLVCCIPLFFVFVIRINLWILRSLLDFIGNVRRGDTEIVW
jgi:hypothetical protein